MGIGQATALVSRAYLDSSLGGSHINTYRNIRRHMQAHISIQVRTETQRVSQEHNIQVLLATHRGRGLASISVVGGAMLQSSISID